MNETAVLALAIAAPLFGIVEEVNANGRALLPWAVICLALIPILSKSL